MPPTTSTRRRAPAMSAEDRRAMIVRSVLPLVVQHGTAVTTSQIARAAGIGEGTIFRVFADKDALVDACVAEVLRPDAACAIIAEIPTDVPLPQRLTEAADALTAHLQRIGALFGSLHASGRPPRREPGARPGKDARPAAIAALREALAPLFEPEADRFRLGPTEIAGLFLTLLLGSAREPEPRPSTSDVVAVFLYGALRAEDA